MTAHALRQHRVMDNKGLTVTVMSVDATPASEGHFQKTYCEPRWLGIKMECESGWQNRI